MRREKSTMQLPLLEVTNLRIALATPYGMVDTVRGIDFSLTAGGTLGLIGESGCGKSLTALALMGLLPEGASVSGSMRLGGQELVGLGESALCALRGNRIAMVFQEPMAALNPLHRVGDQVAEPLRIHRGWSRRRARDEARALLERVGIADAARRMDGYPHEFSGGQRQRICIAMALACGPDLLVADEPTTALDTEVQAQILALLAELVAERGMALLLISHDLAVVAQHTTNMLVMYGGTVVEAGPTQEVFARMAHPYTRGLLARAQCWAATRAPGPRCARPYRPLLAACHRRTCCRRAAPLPGAALSPSTPATPRRRRQWIWASHRARCIRPEAIAAMRHERDYS
jgi:peptide/nickel transport system ATP-binding protein